MYGDTPELPKVESMTLSPRSPYAATKAACEGFLTAFHASYGLEGVALRYFFPELETAQEKDPDPPAPAPSA